MSRTWSPWAVALSLVPLAMAGCSAPALPLAEAKASVSLSAPQRFYAVGEPIILEMSLFNADQQAILAEGELWRGERLQLVNAAGAEQVASPLLQVADEILAPGQRLTREMPVTEIFPQLQMPGSYALTVVFPSFRSNTVALDIIPAFDPDADYLAEVQTDLGNFTLSFYPEVAPEHVRNFVNLARSGYYDQVIVHRIMPGVMFQTGDPTSSGRGGPGWTLRAEFNDRPHRKGTLSMARQADNPNSAGSQWFVCLDSIAEWDGRYTVFGQVEAGMETVEAIGRVKVRNEVPQEEITLQRVVIRESPAAAGGDQDS